MCISVFPVIFRRQNNRLWIVEYVIFTVVGVHPLENICSNMRKSSQSVLHLLLAVIF